MRRQSLDMGFYGGDRLDNYVSVAYDPARTGPTSFAKRVSEWWEILWYECGCGETRSKPGECCGQAMKRRS